MFQAVAPPRKTRLLPALRRTQARNRDMQKRTVELESELQKGTLTENAIWNRVETQFIGEHIKLRCDPLEAEEFRPKLPRVAKPRQHSSDAEKKLWEQQKRVTEEELRRAISEGAHDAFVELAAQEVTRLSTETAVAEVARALADKKTTMAATATAADRAVGQRDTATKSLTRLSRTHVRTVEAGPAARSEPARKADEGVARRPQAQEPNKTGSGQVKYALDDQRVKQLRRHERLTGYLDLAMTYKRRLALRENLAVSEGLFDYPNNSKHAGSPVAYWPRGRLRTDTVSDVPRAEQARLDQRLVKREWK